MHAFMYVPLGVHDFFFACFYVHLRACACV